mgnify:CR=1 FL=1
MFGLEKLKRYVGLKIKVDFTTGERAGGINPRDPNLVCLGWQNLETGWELRLIVNEEKIDEYIQKYKDVEGVEIIEGIENIDKAIDEIIPPEDQEDYTVIMPELLIASVISKHLDPKDPFNVNDIPNPSTVEEPIEKTRRRVLKHLVEQGIKGIRPIRRVKKLSEML